MQLTSGTAYLIIRAALAYDAGVPAIDVINGGWSGGKAANWALNTKSTNYASMIPVLAPHLVVIETGVNDANTGTGLSAYEASLRSLVASCKAAGADVVLVTSPASNTTVVSADTRTTYDNVTKLVASDNSLGVVDLVALMGTWATQNAAGKTYDNVHPNKLGSADMGAYIYQGIAQQLAAS